MKKPKMKFETLGKKERFLLLTALGIDPKNLVCKFCNEKTTYEKCGIMPAVDDDKKATIICGEIMCVTIYLEKAGQ